MAYRVTFTVDVTGDEIVVYDFDEPLDDGAEVTLDGSRYRVVGGGVSAGWSSSDGGPIDVTVTHLSVTPVDPK